MSSVIGGSLPSLVVTSNIISATTNTTDASAQQGVSTVQTTPELQPSEAQVMLLNFWQKQLQEVQSLDVNDFKIQELPLARIKKIMKMDEDVKMISAEAPLLFAKAAQMFITELSLRAWIHTEDNKRRTLQRNDIATAITKFDQFDFLIDIVPREEVKPARRPTEEPRSTGGETVQYFYSMPQQQQQQQQQQQTQAQTVTVVGQSTTQGSSSNLQPNQVVVTPQGQIVQFTSNNQVIGNVDGGQQIIQLSQPQQQNQQQQNNTVVMNNQPQQQQASIVFNPQQETQQQQTTINQTILQQLINNSGTSASEIHSVQINPDGQIQLIKVPSNQSDSNQNTTPQQNQQQQTVVRLDPSDSGQQMFDIRTTT